MFLAYNANEGLPFVPTRELKVDIANGSELVAGNDVREGGYLIGLVSSLKPVTLENGQAGAQLTLKLDKSYGNVPVDSTISIQPRSVLGLKYLDLHKGASHRISRTAPRCPMSQTNVPVQFDDVFKIFDTQTRTAVAEEPGRVRRHARLARVGAERHDLEPAGAVRAPRAGRPLPVRSEHRAHPVLQRPELVHGRGGAGRAGQRPAVREDGDDVRGDRSQPGRSEGDDRESPATLQVSTQSLAAQQPLLTDLTTFGNNMTPATQSLKVALPILNPALEQGTQVLGRTPPLNQRLQETMQALQTLAAAPGTNVALNALVDTVQTLNPMVRYLGPYQTVCDDWNYWWTYLAEHISEATAFGFAQRAMLMTTNTAQPNNVGDQGATAPVNGGSFDSPQGGNEFLHGEVYGAAVDNQGNADCETGQRGYVKKLNALDPQGRNLDSDSHTPGDQGPTFAGRAHVPAGETFTRAPQTGPQLASDPGEQLMLRTTRTQSRTEQVQGGLLAIIAIVLFTYLGFTKFANPFASPYTVHAVFSNANGLQPDSLVRIAGVNVGKVTSVGAVPGCKTGGSLQKTGARQLAAVLGRGRHDDDRRLGAAAPQGRDVRDPAPHLPRRELLRRRQPGHARGAGRARSLHVPDPAGNRAGPVRPGADLAAVGHAAEPADAAPAVRHRAEEGRPVLQRLDPVLAPGVQVLRDRRPRRARARPPRPVERDQRPGDGVGRDRHPSAEPPEPDHELQHDRGVVRA